MNTSNNYGMVQDTFADELHVPYPSMTTFNLFQHASAAFFAS